METQITPQLIIDEVCNVFGVTEQQIKSYSRKPNICLAREITILLLNKYFPYSYKWVAFIVKRPSHSTISCAVTKANRKRDKNPVYNKYCEVIETRIKAKIGLIETTPDYMLNDCVNIINLCSGVMQQLIGLNGLNSPFVEEVVNFSKKLNNRFSGYIKYKEFENEFQSH